jgi:hypothetical protein
MIGLMFLLVFGIYLVVTAWVVKFTAGWARRTRRGVKKWGIAAAFFMYLLVFWDHIPTLLLYKYYCASKAGFWVYKTPEQWKKENPGVAETLTWKSNSPQYDKSDGTRGLRVNERFVWEEKEIDTSILPVTLYEESVIDVKTGEIMVKRVSVGAGYTGGMELLRFWTKLDPFIPSIKEFGYYQKAFAEMGREIQ